MTGGQVRVTIPKGLVRAKEFLKAGYVQLEDKYDNQIIIKGVELNAEKTVDGKADTDSIDK
jgi:hypothetical protein